MALVLGADIGGSTLRVGLVDSTTGTLVDSHKVLLEDKSVELVVSGAAQMVEAMASRGASGPMGIAIAAMVRDNRVVSAPNLGWRDVDFAGLLSERVGRPVMLLNDLSAAAWGEYRAGASKDVADTLTVFVGTGVGSAIIANGQLLSGAIGVAAEFGHVKVTVKGGRSCGCGQQGCLEAYAGGANLIAWMSESGLWGSPADLEQLAASGNSTAARLHDYVAEQLGLAIANQVTMLNPAMLVLGGGVLMHCPRLVERIRAIVATRTSAPSSKVRIELAQLGDDCGILGAGLLAASHLS